MPLVLGRRRGALGRALVVVAASLLFVVLPGARAANAGPVGATTLVLDSQSTDVVGNGTFDVAIAVHSLVPFADLAMQATLYSQLPNRTYFDYSLNGIEEPYESCLSQTTTISLSSATETADGAYAFALPVAEEVSGAAACSGEGSTLDLACSSNSCSGVYPLEIALIDTASGTRVASFTTHLIELASASGLHRLDVGIVLPLGASTALTPGGQSTLSTDEISELSAIVTQLSQHRQVRLSTAIYGQLLTALSAAGPSGRSVLRRLDSLIRSRWSAHTIEPLATTFAPYDTSTLAAAHLGATFGDQLQVGAARLTLRLGRSPTPQPYLVSGALSSGGNRLLGASCIHQLVLPSGAAGTTEFTLTAPVVVTPTAPCSAGGDSSASSTQTTAFVADPSANLLEHPGSDPVLVAHQFLAELAQIYFEAPNARPRAVVVAPAGLVDPTLLGTVLAGLQSNPILQGATLGALFSEVNVGPAGVSAELALPSTAPGGPDLDTTAIDKSATTVRAVDSLVPKDHRLLNSLNESLQLAESSGLSGAARSAFLAEPERQLQAIGSSLSFQGSENVTLTSTSGNIPITIRQVARDGPMNVVVALASSALLFPKGARQSLSLTAKDYPASFRVETLRSGDAHVDVKVLSPIGNRVLLESPFVVQSRAISGVAIVISLAALAVLIGWWLRSVRRSRRARRQHAAVT